ncbi:N-acetyl-gamma-glutamyl-phosphate reductase [Saxibacter everestensis]|uniref:N-acetyl-gamma-glutamyl-phosphate reductase n=1 Tax=Saxibacter everestensis TaxID=2909229 RepID=A0ABY8QY17_9MICO|nr:N-acetyl-gamma-glutamyl-phosphate reductase [Brevibacteriaceae bacterium ZFBP1038]
MPLSVAVSGATGYAGGEVLRLLSSHPELQVSTLAGHQSAGSLLGEHQPHLVRFADRQIVATTAEDLAGHDVIFLALPHGASGAIAAEIARLSPESLVVDLGADHRLVSAEAWQKFYGSDHPGTWTYGLPELQLPEGKQREQIPGTKRLAVPGCNVTAVTLATAPLLAAGLIEPDDLVAVLANGPSGAGKSAKTHLLASEILGSASPYGVGGGHRHVPEIEQNLNWSVGADAATGPVRISFTPTLVPMARGILATVTARIKDGVTQAALRAAVQTSYGDEPFVHLLPEGQWPQTASTVGANTSLIQLALDERAGRVVVTCVLDNLVKGTAGQALQATHLALGLPETLALPLEGVAP